jgi:hypothetical protein
VKREVEPPHHFPNFQGVIFAAIEMREAHLLFGSSATARILFSAHFP